MTAWLCCAPCQCISVPAVPPFFLSLSDPSFSSPLEDYETRAQTQRAEALQGNKGQKAMLAVLPKACRIASRCQDHTRTLFSKIPQQMQGCMVSTETTYLATEEQGNHMQHAPTVSRNLGGLPGELAMAPCSPGNAVLSTRTFGGVLRHSQPWLTPSSSRLAVSSLVPIGVSLHLV